jgi:hypothetical protein
MARSPAPLQIVRMLRFTKLMRFPKTGWPLRKDSGGEYQVPSFLINNPKTAWPPLLREATRREAHLCILHTESRSKANNDDRTSAKREGWKGAKVSEAHHDIIAAIFDPKPKRHVHKADPSVRTQKNARIIQPCLA